MGCDENLILQVLTKHWPSFK